MDNRFKKQLDFILEIDKEKNIFRQNNITGNGRRENDAEHAWHMAIMIYLLREYSNEDFDVAKAMMMALIHDIVEIDAGDTYAYGDDGKDSQQEREEKAAQRIFGLLPDGQRDELIALFHEFEACETSEARFARAMDNFQPFLLNNSNDGDSWREHGVTYSRIYNRQIRSKKGSEHVWNYTEKMIEENILKGNIIDDKQ
ncbi:MAG: HD domain-containing protein [Clostridia bacterium]|nr:HD domain-containing protein [Clostridia bacterium]